MGVSGRTPPGKLRTSDDALWRRRGRREAQEWMLAEIMSEVTEAPVIIQPAKSEDKLEIEKEEAGDTTEKAEEVGEKAAESAEKAAESDEKVAEAADGEKTEEKPASEDVESSEVTEEKKEEEGDEKVEGASEEQKDSEDVGGGEKKKFSLSQIKTPKIIKEIRSRSKSRDKKKKKEGEETEGATGGEEKAEEGGEEAEKAEESDLINEAKAKVKDAMVNIILPKMPKVHKPEFMKKKGKKKGKKG